MKSEKSMKSTKSTKIRVFPKIQSIVDTETLTREKGGFWILKIFRIPNLVFVQNHQRHQRSMIAPRKTIKIRDDTGYL